MKNILTRCRAHPYYEIIRTFVPNGFRRFLFYWVYTGIPNLGQTIGKFANSLQKTFLSFEQAVHIGINRLMGRRPVPLWLIKIFPPIRKIRKLIGEEAYDHIISLAESIPDQRDAIRHMAMFMWNSGIQDHGIAMYAALLNDYGADAPPAVSEIATYLQMLMFGTPKVQTDQHIYDEHVRWSQHFAKGEIYKNYSNPPISGRRLRIGYTCHFITGATSKTLLQPLLARHDRKRLEVFMYSDETPHTVTDDIRNIVEHWRDTYGMDEDAFCELVRKDQIDILLELNGHGSYNRYREITRHPAPVQVAWYNYACTTGLPGMDYTLVSDDIEIENLQDFYSEQIFRKRGSSHAMIIGDHFPNGLPPPFEKNGFITFGSFGQAHKVTRQQIFLWCKVLQRVPRSKFFMKAGALGEPASRAAFIHHFKDGGIDESRLIMEGNSDYDTLLKCYGRVDIGLDTFPCNAGTTTVDATIQGVPVISMIGYRYSSQMARPNLESGGHPELLCRSPEEFVKKAVSLANDPARLRLYRKTLRSDFANSKRCNVAEFLIELEEAFQEMWRRYSGGVIELSQPNK